MARSTKTSKVTIEDPKERGEINKRVGEQLCKLLKDMYFEVEAASTLTVKMKDDTYRKKPVTPGLEFTPISTYIGARQDLIICMEPADAQQFKFVEVNVKQADTYFPLMGSKLAEALNSKTESMTDLVRDIFKEKMNEYAEEKRAEKQKTENVYASHPLAGRF